ncbi:DUF3592 domain-containing protein [Amycolatopsis sp. SID8362]|uniref:DUF3592 domain-containing protein n=1 Tax=Amycolatopsis sp. SID8362 TaxID=2690346 RepID=UPI001371473E|nr:DUF3592 domain-containing protein [Amycolatopsis sp. SID8362]NBH09072.1 DUF3592 domain-containing protein [Amycolatopsis sp. SID8362]NED45764.1 DUF3592 domain-containing protein [Amycolatopsis sp. SID8362]
MGVRHIRERLRASRTGAVVGKGALWLVLAALTVAFAFLGYGFVRTGLDGIAESSARGEREQTVDGIILERQETGLPQGQSSRRILVRYTVPGGRSYTFSQGGDGNVGDTVVIHYDPRHPDSASLNSATGDNVGNGLLAGLGGSLLLFPPLVFIVGVVRSVRRR